MACHHFEHLKPVPSAKASYAKGCAECIEDGRYVGASAGVFGVRECGVLRLVEEQACDEALSCDQASGDAVGGAGRGLGMVLCG